MAQHVQSLMYSLVARGSVVLADYSAFTSASFSTIAALSLPNLPNRSSNNMLCYTCDGHIFNFLVQDGFTYLVVSDNSTRREISLAFLEHIKEDFQKRYGDGNITNTISTHGLDKDFGPKLKEHMQYCVDHPKEMIKLTIVKDQVPEVEDIIMENIDKILDGREKIELVVDNIEIQRVHAENFHRQGKQLRQKMWLHHMKVRLVVIMIAILLILLVWLAICKGFVC